MKTSAILIISAVVITLIALTAYNFTLRASYLKGNYKNPFYGMEFTPIKDLNSITIGSANRVSIVIEHGVKEGIWLTGDASQMVSWSHQNHDLQIDLTRKSKEEHDWISGRSIIIVTNHLAKVTTKAYYKSREDENSYTIGETEITGYKEGSLQLLMDRSTTIYMDKNQLQSVNAIVGDAQHGGSRLNLSKDNTIGSADFTVAGDSEIHLTGPNITKTNYNLSDKASVLLNGKALQAIRN